MDYGAEDTSVVLLRILFEQHVYVWLSNARKALYYCCNGQEDFWLDYQESCSVIFLYFLLTNVIVQFKMILILRIEFPNHTD